MRLENLSYEGESVREGFIEDENGNLIPNDVPLPLSYSITELPNSSLGIIKDAMVMPSKQTQASRLQRSEACSLSPTQIRTLGKTMEHSNSQLAMDSPSQQ